MLRIKPLGQNDKSEGPLYLIFLKEGLYRKAKQTVMTTANILGFSQYLQYFLCQHIFISSISNISQQVIERGH